jgi:hypothetical protein
VFENRVLRRILTPKGDEVTEGKLCTFYSLPSIIRMMKSRRMKWERRGTHVGYWWESQQERDH